MYYIYVLDYASDSIYEIKVEHGDIKNYSVDDADKILVEQGFNLDEISYMVTEFEQDKVSMVYSELI